MLQGIGGYAACRCRYTSRGIVRSLGKTWTCRITHLRLCHWSSSIKTHVMRGKLGLLWTRNKCLLTDTYKRFLIWGTVVKREICSWRPTTLRGLIQLTEYKKHSKLMLYPTLSPHDSAYVCQQGWLSLRKSCLISDSYDCMSAMTQRQKYHYSRLYSGASANSWQLENRWANATLYQCWTVGFHVFNTTLGKRLVPKESNQSCKVAFPR